MKVFVSLSVIPLEAAECAEGSTGWVGFVIIYLRLSTDSLPARVQSFIFDQKDSQWHFR